VVKFLYDKFFLQPRLERVRAQRKAALRAVKKGEVQLDADTKALMRETLPTLKRIASEHPVLVNARRWVEARRAARAAEGSASQGDGSATAAATPAEGRRLACLTLALPLANGKHW
jgi:hypothetical protein